MAQMPIQTMSGRADPHAALSPAAVTSRPKVAISRASYVYDSGGISGGMLRPGSVDQQLFKAHLAAAQKEALLAPSAMPKAPSHAGIPTLTPAQLAAFGIDVGQQAGDAAAVAAQSDPASLVTAAGETSTAETPGTETGGTLNTGLPVALDPSAREPSASEVADAALEHLAETAALPQSIPPQAVERGPFPGARRGADGVWELTRRPDKDEREMLYGQKWRVVENEDSRKLFLGPDGEFGWDDFLDIVNPLQHIPFVNIAYRAVTGDEIYGAARMVDFAFGPMAGASTAVDLAFRDVTGNSMAENAIAAVFGPGETAPSESGPSESGPSEAGDLASVNTASADRVQLADAGALRRGSNK